MKNFSYLWVMLGFLARLLPHLPNITPSSSTSLFAGAKLPRKNAILAVVVMAIISDLLLSIVHKHAVFGYWTLFTYSGFIFTIFLGKFLEKTWNAKTAMFTSCLATSLFWIWTNFGTWLTSGMYTHDSIGFFACFSLALPFLGASLVGDLIWMLLLFFGADLLEKKLPSKYKFYQSQKI